MKSILIGGVPRSGKSTLANLLLHQGYSVLRGDKIMSALVRTHPEVNISRDATPEQVVLERTPFLLALLRKLIQDDTIPYVLDSTLLSPDLVRQKADDLCRTCIPVFVGYPNAEPTTKLCQIKDYARGYDCLSHDMSEPDVVKWIARWIVESREIQQRCSQYGFHFVDTSHEFEASLIGAVAQIIEQNPNHTSEDIVAKRAESSR